MLYHPVKAGNLEIPGNLFLAPVAGYSDRAFRSVCAVWGADFAFTEMVSAEALVRASEKTAGLMEKGKAEKLYGIQLFGSNPVVMSKAVEIVLSRYEPAVIDVNCGCPVPKVVKSNSGSYLTRNPDLLKAIVGAMVKKISDMGSFCPVSVKIRSGWDSSSLTWKEAAFAALEAGAAMIGFHPRTRAQGYSGKADWKLLAELSRDVHSTFPGVPVIGSGDLFSPEDALSMLQETSCDGVMFARGAMGNPFIFSMTKELLTNGRYTPVNFEQKIRTAFMELAELVSDKGEKTACREMRKRFCAYVKGFPGSAEIRNLIVQAESLEDYRRIFAEKGLMTESIFGSGM